MYSIKWCKDCKTCYFFWTKLKSTKKQIYSKTIEVVKTFLNPYNQRVYYIERKSTKWVLSQKRKLQLEYVSLGSAIMFGWRVHLYLQFLLQLVHLYSTYHFYRLKCCFFWQKTFIPRERLMSSNCTGQNYFWILSVNWTKLLRHCCSWSFVKSDFSLNGCFFLYMICPRILG